MPQPFRAMIQDPAGRALRERLLEVFRLPGTSPLSESQFDALARDIFAWQYAHNPAYAAYCARRRATPDTIERWSDIPPVPTAAFKAVPLVAGSPGDAAAIFHTSGTTAGEARRGTHYVLDLGLYHEASLAIFAAWLLPGGERLPMLSLLPPADDMPDSSLAHMISTVVTRLGAEGSGWFASAGGGLDTAGLAAALNEAIDSDTPVCLLGTTLSFVHWLDVLRDDGVRFALPHGSRLMDTGGFKGRTREVDPDGMRAAYREILGVPALSCINEYGMTEMLSQFYDSTLRRAGPRRKVPPPWVRTRIVEPDTLRPSETGSGLLQHFDLANLGTVIGVQTEDVGEAVADGFRVLGRASGAPPRGCSLAMDDLLAATRRTG